MTRRKNVAPEMVQIEAHELECLRLRIGALEGVEGTQQLEIQRLEADYKKYRNRSMDQEKEIADLRGQVSSLRDQLYDAEHQVSRMAGYLQALEDQKPPRMVEEERVSQAAAVYGSELNYHRKGWYNV